ncbi:MAG: metal ABC transporter ATP-binding protein [Nitrospirae bacterium]|nr:metal ABC transporter ATP-binding protein [Nitrospirota bacterium]MBF0534111.1 metal ABC transporter ATP-binding protein [Nitrospirota bacterium]MBF0616998.1 metal ABC transporter ATP-binding protein [Nitrospirota bacterium]
MEQFCLEARGIEHSYGKEKVLENVTFSIAAGSYVGLIGPNGGGKTTLIKILLGLTKPDAGKVYVFGESLSNYKKKYHLGYVPQQVSQLENSFPATVSEIVKTGRTARVGLYKNFTHKDKEAVNTAMEIAGVSEYKDRLIGKLSGGQKQKVFIARALAGDPKVLFLDEPMVGIDIVSRESFYTFLKRLNKENGITIVFISHDLGVISEEVETILCLNKKLFCHSKSGETSIDQLIEDSYGKKVSAVRHIH